MEDMPGHMPRNMVFEPQSPPLVVELPAPIDVSKASLRFWYSESDPAKVLVKITYDASAPAGVGAAPGYTLPAGGGTLRIWKKNGSAARNKIAASQPVLDGSGNPVKDADGNTVYGDFVPTGQVLTLAQLGFGAGDRLRTFYVEAVAPSATVAASQIKVEVDPDGPPEASPENPSGGPAGFMAMDAVRVTAMKVDLQTTNAHECGEEKPGTPLLLNDDWDGGHKYGDGGAAIPGGKREKEPIWDCDYKGGEDAAEDDLMKVSLRVLPADMPGDVYLKLPAGGGNVCIWPKATKGVVGDIVAVPAGGLKYAIKDLPTAPLRDIYVEGVVQGRTEMMLEYQYNATTLLSDKLNVDVLTLVEKQGGVRKVINTYNVDIVFELQPPPLAANYICHWDLDGDGTFSNNAWENNTAKKQTIKYSAGASAAGNVQLVANAANVADRRKEYKVQVKLQAGDLAGELVMTRKIRVALGSYEGTPVKVAVADRRVEVAGLAAPPAGFTNTPSVVSGVNVTAGGKGYPAATTVTFTGGDGNGATANAIIANGVVTRITVTNGGTGYTSAPTVSIVGKGGADATATAVLADEAAAQYSQAWFQANYGVEVSPPGTSINAGNRLQYSTKVNFYGETPFDGVGAARRVFLVMVFKAAYDAGLKQEDLQSIARHECNHASQMIDVKNGGNVWRELDDYYGGVTPSNANFLESDSYCVNLKSNGSWKYLATRLPKFKTNYEDANVALATIANAPTKTSAKVLLQGIYDRLPFDEMKRTGYDYYVRAPQ